MRPWICWICLWAVQKQTSISSLSSECVASSPLNCTLKPYLHRVFKHGIPLFTISESPSSILIQRLSSIL